MKMRSVKLTRQEKAVEDAIVKGEYISAGKDEFDEIARAITARRKDAVLNIRLNSRDLKQLKSRAHRLGLRYQTFISEILHRIAQAS
ncbi:MAG: antitoxin [Candidatus Omnitrophica bacterium]|nr:antitoxin [Candidatus Omnitrophota bacterium]